MACCRDLDAAWDAAAPLSTFGAAAALDRRLPLAAAWPVDAARARYGELTVPWRVVADG